MKTQIRLIAVLLLLTFSFSCSKDDDKTAPIIAEPVTDVYAVGFEEDGSKITAKIWKNSVATPLTDGENNTSASAIYIANKDIYVVGTGSNGIEDIGIVWTNGIPKKLTQRLRSYAHSIFFQRLTYI